MPEATYEAKLSIPLSTIKALRRKFPAENPDASVAAAMEELVRQTSRGVLLSEKMLLELCSVLNAEQITSESELIAAARRCLNVGPNHVLVEIDPSLSYYVRDAAERNKIPFAQSVANYFHQIFAQGWFQNSWDLFWIGFTGKQWKELKELLRGKPNVAESIIAALKEWTFDDEEVAALQKLRHPEQPWSPGPKTPVAPTGGPNGQTISF